jgi:hypothetical protein
MKLHTLQMQFNPQAYSEKKKQKKRRKTMAPTMSIVQSLYLQVSIFKTGKEGGAYLQLLI